MLMAKCEVCFRHCEIKEGALGFCGARTCKNGRVVSENYGRITSCALDPIEKKPLARFFPGSKILSVGSYGCNLRCPFCQNSEISWGEEVAMFQKDQNATSGRMAMVQEVTPDDLVRVALREKDEGNIGVAFTYNEPFISYEFVRDTAKLSQKYGLKNVLVTNGTVELPILRELLPSIDAMNIDLKGFTDRYYEKVLGGNRKVVMDCIEESVKSCHVELTTLIVPGENDDPEEIREMTKWICGLKDKDGKVIGETIPLHVSRFFPRFHMQEKSATAVSTVYRLAEVARESLKYVYTGNC